MGFSEHLNAVASYLRVFIGYIDGRTCVMVRRLGHSCMIQDNDKQNERQSRMTNLKGIRGMFVLVSPADVRKRYARQRGGLDWLSRPLGFSST